MYDSAQTISQNGGY
jgi:hypothetical protein